MRRLRNTDLLELVEIMTSCEGVVDELGDLLYESYEEKEKKSDKENVLSGIEMTRVVVNSVLKHSGRKALNWLAGIAEMSFEEFDEAGPRKITETLSFLADQEDIKDFFAEACKLFLGATG